MHPPRLALLLPPSVLLGALSVRCAPPTATLPAPTPVYAEELTVEPVEITRHSLGESHTTALAPSDENTLEAAPPAEDEPQAEAPETADEAEDEESSGSD